MERKINKKIIYKILVAVFVFWFLDFLAHNIGVGETNFYYASKLGNAILFAVIWFSILGYGKNWKKLIYSFAFGTYISFYYLIASYSGLVQFFFGIYARYTPPPFVIFGVYLPSFIWWIFHSLAFYLGIIISDILIEKQQ